jgi:hypothetical protein
MANTADLEKLNGDIENIVKKTKNVTRSSLKDAIT